ncbi:SbcC/MukB-like Walker B domain-containing protein [Priestia koreensis]|uniref:Nuclease SbcCD subunit C n=1 Tax=Priestia koreensis TaxID=284581 RepID=A0A0M0LHR4_9BACI|nr:SbcC/MukB-like Walker B domain-containing protein [Priestia koreensis]KOO50253.1 hypothetical protein AMD01_00315 [Priestia koreensis]
MKPISLSIAGLHSFREKQIIDFEDLCNGGVFGIFGTTGSGKSSILDAMTLALYGKVERAANNTQGILNHAENELKVSFTFELENASNKKRYKVERSFKRSDELRVKSATSRIVEVGEEQFVLADKTNEVNQHVQDLLGLTIDDFTRAVVLPQGKFAEFLSLKGAERRQMLQRLFNLEQYGDQLTKKLRAKVQAVTSDLDKIMAEQAGLGEASKERLQEAKEELEGSQKLLAKRQGELAEVEKLYEKEKQLWQWHQEQVSLEEELRKLADQEIEIERKQETLKHAEAADKLKPYLEDLERTKKQVETSQQRIDELTMSLEKAKGQYEQAQAQYEKVREHKKEQEPLLLGKKEQLQQAKKLEQAIEEAKNQVKQLDEKRLNQEKEMAETKNGLEKARSLLVRGTEKQQVLKGELEAVVVPFEYREQVQKAYSEKQRLSGIQLSISELEEELKQKDASYMNLVSRQKSQEEQVKRSEQQGNELFGSLQEAYEVVCERERECEALLQQGEEHVEEMKKKQQREQVKHLALTLAKGLSEGEACPVCGATHHPQLATEVSGEEKDGQKQALEQILREFRPSAGEFASLKLQLQHYAEQLVAEGFSKAQLEKTDVAPIQELNEEALIDYMTNMESEIKSLQQDQLQIRDRVQRFLSDVRKLHQEKQSLHIQLEREEKDQEIGKEKLKKRQEEHLTALRQFEKAYPHMELEQVDELQKEISERDKKEQELKEKLNISVRFLEEQQQKTERFTNQVSILEKDLAETTFSYKTKNEAVEEKNGELRSIIGQGNVDVLWAETTQKLAKLTEMEESSYQMLQQLQKVYQSIERDAQAEQHLLQQSTDHLQASSQSWEERLGNSYFASAEEVKAAFLSEDVMKGLSERIQAFLETIKTIRHDLDAVNKKLHEQEITEEKWLQTQQLREELHSSVNEAVRATGAAQKALEDIENRHERFNDLEEKREEYAHLSEQYQKLQSVFKGNSFVEYIAEEQLMNVTRDASKRLGMLTRQRYAIEIDSQGGFIMRDDANGGVKRPVSSLSGGETFLTSLALALSLSAQIQLRGEYPLQFFFLDEGFGTLDGELLDNVVTSLEKIQSQQLSIGVISHVQELRARLPKRLLVEAAEPSGRGTRVKIETL